MAEDTQVTALLVAHRKILRNTLIRVTFYYAALIVLLGIFVSAFPSMVNELPLGGVGDIAGYNASGLLALEEALLSADGEELEELARATSEARREAGPAWLAGALSLFYAMTSTLILMLPVSWVCRPKARCTAPRVESRLPFILWV